MEIARGLPRDLPSAVFMAVHFPGVPSVLPRIQSRAALIEAVHPEKVEPVRQGTIHAPLNNLEESVAMADTG